MWTYSGNPSTRPLDHVRFLIGDVLINDQLLSDIEIEFVLTQSTEVVIAAAICCERIAARFARDVDVKIESTSVSAGDRYNHFMALARDLRASIGDLGIPYAGNILLSDGEIDRADNSLSQPSFLIGLMDNKYQ